MNNILHSLQPFPHATIHPTGPAQVAQAMVPGRTYESRLLSALTRRISRRHISVAQLERETSEFTDNYSKASFNIIKLSVELTDIGYDFNTKTLTSETAETRAHADRLLFTMEETRRLVRLFERYAKMAGKDIKDLKWEIMELEEKCEELRGVIAEKTRVHAELNLLMDALADDLEAKLKF